jgi:molybdopterin-guanine dinucleotide biosynthesis protein A
VAEAGPPPFDAIILAGGRGARLGGADKPGLVVGRSTMAVTTARAAVTAGARRLILVGPERPDVAAVAAPAGAALVVTREDPPGGGPVPALRAGLAQAAAPWVAVLAADLPFLRGDQVRALVAAAARGSSAGAVIADESGAEQWLAGCWRAGRLATALAAYPGRSLRGLLRPLSPVLVREAGRPGAPSPWLDCDTPAELAAARAWLAAPAAAPVPSPAGAAPPGGTGPGAAGAGAAAPGIYRTDCGIRPPSPARPGSWPPDDDPPEPGAAESEASR